MFRRSGLSVAPFSSENTYYVEVAFSRRWLAMRLGLRSRSAGNPPQYPAFRVGGCDVGSSAASGVARELTPACPGRVGGAENFVGENQQGVSDRYDSRRLLAPRLGGDPPELVLEEAILLSRGGPGAFRQSVW